mmetsp:Transcript_24663/g.36333  ORF Transcript_24663/g.36333 Transcript_24663/m.36333 type:complete len:323 (-) Transcript_24663:211-1179(-)
MAYKKAPGKGLSVMEKKVPQNKKYANIESKLDTGCTVNKVKFISNSEFSKRRDEIFFRLSKRQMYELYSEYEADEYEDIAEADSSFDGPKIVTYTESSKPTYSKPYLILDIRDPAAFNDYHMLQARSFPSVMLRRDQVHPELPAFRNKEGHLVIVVSDDEKSAREAAKVLVDRGTDNVFMLSCTVQEFAEEYGSFVEGNVPAPKSTPKHSGMMSLSDAKSSRGSSRGSSVASSRIGTGVSERSRMMERSGPGAMASARSGAAATVLTSLKHPSGAAALARERKNLRSGYSDTMSTASNMSTNSHASVAESVISRSVARKGKI